MYFGQENFFYESWIKFADPFTTTQKRYAFTLGNHDDGGDLNREQIAALDMTNPYSLMQASHGIHGISNYYLPVHSYNSDNASALLWLLDSGDNGCYSEINGWGCVHEDQVQWYNKTTWELKKRYGNNTHGIAFMHIPPHQFMNLYNDGSFYGDWMELVSCPLLDTNVLDVMAKNKDVSAVFVGHDHDSAWGGWWNEMELVYGRKSGYGGYGPSMPGVGHGGRVIVLKENLDENGEVRNVTRDHWVVYENGTIENNKTLKGRGNSAYQWYCSIPSEDVDPIYVFVPEFLGCVGFVVLWFWLGRGIVGGLRRKMREGKGDLERVELEDLDQIQDGKWKA